VKVLVIDIGGTHLKALATGVREVSGRGRRACAPRRTAEKDHLGALNKLARGRFLATPLFSLRENAISNEPSAPLSR